MRLTLSLVLLLALASAAPATAAPGDLDPSFGVFGKVVFNPREETLARDLAVQPDGRIVVAGSEPVSAFGAPATVFRYLANGDLDQSFGVGGTASVHPNDASVFRSVVVQPDGKIVAASSVLHAGGFPEIVVARFDSAGSPDQGFGAGGLVETGIAPASRFSTPVDLALAPDGRILLATTAPGTGGFLVARLLADGTPDPSFSGDGSTITDVGAGGTAYAVVVAPDGSVTVAGSGKTAAGEKAAALARYLPDGELDPSFGSGGVARSLLEGHTAELQDLALRPDGSVIASGGLNASSDGGSHAAIAAFTGTGALDLSFAGDGVVPLPEAGAYSALRSVVVAPDGRILATGPSGVGDIVVVRLSADGVFDRTFSRDGRAVTDFGGTFDTTEALALDPQGRIVVTGERIVSGFRSDDHSLALARFLVAAGPHDADADGHLDRRDRCPTLSATGHRGCPFIERSLTLRATAAGGLTGRVMASKRDCRSAGRVALFEAGPGRDQRIARTRPEKGGKFAIDARRLDGRFYTRVGAFLDKDVGLCGAARSRRVALRG